MEHDALVQARQRFARATEALEDLERAASYNEAESAWSDFLLATSTIFSKLEQGAKGQGKSTAWFGRQKRRRKIDPVLQYLHFARNSDEHGIKRVTERHPDSNWQGKPKAFWEREELELEKVDKETGEPTGLKFKAWATGPRLSLVRASDSRFGDYCDPPTLEGELPNDPLAVAKAALPILDEILVEAEELV